MNTTTRAIISVCFALFSIIMLLNKCHEQSEKKYKFEHTWTPELEQQMRDVLYTQIASIEISDSTKNAYVDCCLEKIKEAFPNGISSMKPDQMTDSARMAVIKECSKCTAILIKQANPWPPELIQQLKLQFYSYPETKLLPQSAKSEYVDCLAFKVKTQYPEGMGKAGKDSIKKFISKARNGCLILIVNKYKKQKLRDTVNK